jgi:hypothetical protein
MPLLALRQLVTQFADAVAVRQNKEGLTLVNKLKMTPVDGQVAWFTRNLTGGLSPLVSPLQNSPIVDQGTYREMKAGAIITRHVKRFTNDELMNIMSADDRFRVSEKEHLVREMADMERRIWETMEFVGWKAMTLGRVQYKSTDIANKVDVDVTFPVDTASADATWATTSTTIVTDINNWIEIFEDRYGKKPDVIRMTKKTWNYVKANTQVLATFTSWIRTTGVTKGDIPAGMITPDFVAKACDWPPIEIMSARTAVMYKCKNSEAEGAGVTVELVGGTWGISVGDEALCDYNTGASTSTNPDTWDFKATVTTVTPGVSIALTIPSGKTLTAGDLIVVKPTFFPQQYIQMIADENESEFLLTPFGIDYSGSQIQASKFRGPYFDVFPAAGEPNLAIYRRAWHEFGLAMASKVLTRKIIV